MRAAADANPEIACAWRGGAVESRHRGALAIVDAGGATRLAFGDVDRPVFARSACKALQALPLVASGAADALGLADEELALACASHGGEPGHVAAARSMLAKAGFDGDAAAAVLECGVHAPAHDASAKALFRDGLAPSALHNNCSGKHAGFVCVGCLMARAAGAEPAAFLRGYVEPGHPVMREVTAALGAAVGVELERAVAAGDVVRAVDGCSIPTHALALRALALGFARLGSGAGLAPAHAAAAARLRRAVAAAPWHVAGTGRFDTRLMRRLGERVFCKVGAEGVYAAALPELGLGVALKVDDGTGPRAAEVALAAVVAALLRLDDGDAAFVARLADVELRNWNARAVGRLAASDALREALRRA